jgi:hypothetical protein
MSPELEASGEQSVHEQWRTKYHDELDKLSERLPLYELPSQQECDALSDRIWLEVTKGKPHSCSDCVEEQEELYGAEFVARLQEKIEAAKYEFPMMSGVLWDMALAMFPDIPLEFKFMALVTHFGLIRSGIDVLDGEKHYQPRFFTCFVADPNSGKSAAISEAHRYMEAIKPQTMMVLNSVDSGPALVDDFADLAKSHPSARAVQVLIEADEMTDLFEKSKITAQSRNSLSTMLLSLFETTIASNRARSAHKGQRTQVENAHLAVLGGTTFLGAETMWNKIGGGANGLQSRFVPIVTTQGPLGLATRTPSHADAFDRALGRLIKLNELPGQTIFLDAEAQQELNEWWSKYTPWDKASVRRIDDIVKRMIIVLAVTNIDPNDRDPLDDNCVVVGRDIVGQACEFGTYLINVRERVNPADSYSWTQAFEAAIQGVFEKSPKKMFSMRDVRRAVNADHKPGGYQSFSQAWRTVTTPELGVVELIAKTNKGTPLYRLVQ